MTIAMRVPTMLLSVLLAASAATAVQAAPARWRIDPVHTQVLFFASHLGYSHSMGRFPRVAGTLDWDPDDPASARVEVTIEVASLYLGDEAWEKKMLSRDFFAAEAHPTARFVSTRYVRDARDPKRGTLEGELTLRGVTKPVTLAVRENRVGRHTYSFDYVAGFSATGRIKRSDFGMRRLLPAVGDEVELRLELEWIRTEE